MREIKFRAWDKEEKKMIYGVEENEDIIYFLQSSIFEIMQFTGLHDKNGKEIYESDIVRRWDDGKHFIVAWHKETAGFNLVLASQLEVIGNIYQNPKLIDKRKT